MPRPLDDLPDDEIAPAVRMLWCLAHTPMRCAAFGWKHFATARLLHELGRIELLPHACDDRHFVAVLTYGDWRVST